MQSEPQHMSDSALKVRRYDLDLMTPKEKAAFERTLSSSEDLKNEFWTAGNTLAGLYTRLSEGMPAPRQELKELLLSKISGISPTERAGIIGGGALVALIPSTISDVPPLAVGGDRTESSFSAKKVMTLLIIATLGIVSLFGISNLTSDQNPKAPISSASQNNSGGVVNAAEIGQSATARNMNTASRDLPGAPLAGREHSSIILKDLKRSVLHERITPLIPPEKNNADQNLRMNQINQVETPMPAITATDPMLPTEKNDIGNPFHREHLQVESITTEPGWTQRISFSILHMSTLKFYPGRPDMATPTAFNTLGAALKYELTPFVALGLEAGKETAPFYLGNKQGGYDELYSIVWGGVSVTVSDPLLEVFNCVPEARFVGGFCTAGPMGKLSTGFVWLASSRISLSPELEYTGVFIKNEGIINEGGKLGLTASVIFHF